MRLRIRPSVFVQMDDNEKAFVIACIDKKIEAEKEEEKRSTGSGCSGCDFPAGRSDDGHNADADGSRSGCGI